MTTFDVGFLLVVPFWAAMIVAPNWRVTRRLMGSPAVAAGPAIMYAILAAPRFGELLPALASPRLETIAPLLGAPDGATLAWMHFLAFDLFVARWIYLDAVERSIRVWILSPILITTLMLGPVGFLAYLGVRAVDLARIEQAVAPLAAAFRTGASKYRMLSLYVLAMAALVAICLAGTAFDPREIAGTSVWIKPAKFALSTLVYAGSMLWILGQTRPSRVARIIAAVTAVALGVEVIIITAQAARGVTSHFNMSTYTDAFLFSVMGVFILVVWIANVAAVVLALRERWTDPVHAWSLRLALIVTLTAAIPGVLMTLPSSEQRASIEQGNHVQTIGAHTVGAPDGGPGLPFIGWSTTHGDLRPAHFLALHALQIIPLAGWWISRRRRFSQRTRLAWLAILSSTYLVAVCVLTWQALRGEPVVHPGPTTLAVWAALLGCALAASLATLTFHTTQPAQEEA